MRASIPFVVTREWLDSHRTSAGGFTRKQIEALDIQWPPTAGWLVDLIGTEIASEQAQNFEQAKTKTAKSEKVSTLDLAVEFIRKHRKQLKSQHVESLKASIKDAKF